MTPIDADADAIALSTESSDHTCLTNPPSPHARPQFKSCTSSLAWSIVIATLYHEIAQEIADYILLTSDAVGCSVVKALLFNFLAGEHASAANHHPLSPIPHLPTHSTSYRTTPTNRDAHAHATKHPPTHQAPA